MIQSTLNYRNVSTRLCLVRMDSLSGTAESTLELVKDAIILVQVTQLLPQVVMYVDRLYGFLLHRHIPDL